MVVYTTKRVMAHKYVEVKEALLREIRAGKLNGELPSEETLAQRFSVSRMTARRALEELAAEGWLERGRGRRSRLAELRFGQGFFRVRPFYRFAESVGARPSTRLLAAGPAKPPATVQERLGTSDTIRIERLRFLNDDPVMLEVRYLRTDLCSSILEHDLEAESIHEILVRNLNLPLTQVWQRLEATSLRGRVARLLGVPHRTPGFRLERVTFTFDTPVTWVEYRMRGDRYYFEDVFSPQREVQE